MNIPKKDKIGIKGENIAASYLKKIGYTILERNFKKRYGEIDIIAKINEILIFVEVKTRLSKDFGPPEESITPYKIRSIIKTAQYYQMIHDLYDYSLRIDFIGITIQDTNGKYDLKHYENISN